MKNNENDDIINGDSNGNTTTDYFAKYLNNTGASEKKDDCNNKDINPSNSDAVNSKRIRTFSETLKMLDDDIIADLNVK